MMVWREAPSSLSHDPGFSCVLDVLCDLSTGLLGVVTGGLKVHWLIPGRNLSSSP